METPILLIIYNRPDKTQLLINNLRKKKVRNLFVSSDGPRSPEDKIKVSECRKIIASIDWDCEVRKHYLESNIGCMRAVNSAITWLFDNVEMGIILEDDCLPNDFFFDFINWGLETYKNDPNVGMISGSNLVANLYPKLHRNGYSNFINIWGWGTWKRVWQNHDLFFTIKELNKKIYLNRNLELFNWWQKIFWHQLFKYTIYSGSTWDFQLQHTFFHNNLLAVYPTLNLIDNIGYSADATHTKSKVPDFVKNNLTNNIDNIMSKDILEDYFVNKERDFQLARKIWFYSKFSTFKLLIGNLIRFCF